MTRLAEPRVGRRGLSIDGQVLAAEVRAVGTARPGPPVRGGTQRPLQELVQHQRDRHRAQRDQGEQPAPFAAERRAVIVGALPAAWRVPTGKPASPSVARSCRADRRHVG